MNDAETCLRTTLRGAAGECLILAGPHLGELQHLIGGSRVVIVTDSNVRRLHGASFPAGEIVEIGQGEGAKSLETVVELYHRLLALRVDTDSMILAMGGGIVCDVAAFAAATWLRGIRTGLVPTTLLAQVDAGLGGKNGVNFAGTKNLVGTIRQPAFVLCDPCFLDTLPAAEVNNGLAEIVKAAAVRDAGLFRYLEEHASGLSASVLQRAVAASIRVKLDVVSRDEIGSKVRVVLNFGHTLGHAIEATLGMRHGEAVSIGMVFAARLSVARGLLSPGGARRLERLLSALQLPTSVTTDPSPLIAAVARDKKRSGSTLRMALLRDLGEAIVERVQLDELEAAIADLR